MQKQEVILEDLGRMDYRRAWDYQETLLQKNLDIKSELGTIKHAVRSKSTC